MEKLKLQRYANIFLREKSTWSFFFSALKGKSWTCS